MYFPYLLLQVQSVVDVECESLQPALKKPRIDDFSKEPEKISVNSSSRKKLEMKNSGSSSVRGLSDDPKRRFVRSDSRGEKGKTRSDDKKVEAASEHRHQKHRRSDEKKYEKTASHEKICEKTEGKLKASSSKGNNTNIRSHNGTTLKNYFKEDSSKILEKDAKVEKNSVKLEKGDLKTAADVVVKCLGPYYSEGRFASKVIGCCTVLEISCDIVNIIF